MDRGNSRVSYLYQPLHPAILRALDRTVAAAHAAGIERVRALQEALEPHRGEGGLPIRVHYRRPGAEGRLRLGDTWRVDPSDALLKRLRHLLGGDDKVEVIYQRELQLRPSTPAAAGPPRLAVVS
jgi:DNA polymerase-3 subunit alpha